MGMVDAIANINMNGNSSNHKGGRLYREQTDSPYAFKGIKYDRSRPGESFTVKAGLMDSASLSNPDLIRPAKARCPMKRRWPSNWNLGW